MIIAKTPLATQQAVSFPALAVKFALKQRLCYLLLRKHRTCKQISELYPLGRPACWSL